MTDSRKRHKDGEIFTRHHLMAILFLIAMSAFGVFLTLCNEASDSNKVATTPTEEEPFAVTLTIAPDEVSEGGIVELSVAYSNGTPIEHAWKHGGGPAFELDGKGFQRAVIDLVNFRVAADVEVEVTLEAVSEDGQRASDRVSLLIVPDDMEPALGEFSQIGGSTTAIARHVDASGEWCIYNIANKLCATLVGDPDQTVHSVLTPGFIRDIEIVLHEGVTYALLGLDTEGVGVVNLTNPANPTLVSHVPVNYYQDGITFSDGGGNIIPDNEISGVRSPIMALETDGTTLWIANEEFGIHRTALTNLIGPEAPLTEEDGTLLIDHEVFTLQYAGENPWGGAHDLMLYDNRLFASLGFLGIGIFDPDTLEQVGGYNLYTDTSVSEDWFIDMDVRDEVQSENGDLFIDDFTGMPDYRQASFEVQQVWHGDVEAPTPWADFDRYGKYYYKAYGIDLAEVPGTDGEGDGGNGNSGPRTLAYVAYGMAGLVAVDVTGYDTATPGEGFLTAEYQGYAPAVPAHGPDKPSGTQSKSLYPYYGAGMLKEAGVVDVKVREGLAYFADHFAGLVILDGADDPASNWQGANAPYDNDDPTLADGVLGDHWPDYEFVTSYDMSPYDPTDHESLPAWMYEAPALLASGEVGGHGNVIALTDPLIADAAGNIDVMQAAGSGGLSFIDLIALSTDPALRSFEVPTQFATTDEIGAAADGSPTQAISIGHTQDVGVSERYLYLSDGPHGTSAWQIADSFGLPIEEIHLVANTLQDEYPEEVDGVTVYPTPHATHVAFDRREAALIACQSLGLRRVDITGVEGGDGEVGSPLLLRPQPTDIFEHNGEYGKHPTVKYQDHAYYSVVDGELAYTADGGNGLTIYDLTKDPTNMQSGFVVGDVGAAKQRPPLGRATSVDLWRNAGNRYAFVAAGPYGVGVVDVTNPEAPELIKVFEPIKYEIEDDGEVHIGIAYGRCADVKVIGQHAYFTYDSFGVLCYRLSDLIEPLPAGVDPTEIFQKESGGYDYRPETVAEFRLSEDEEYGEWGGGALYFDYTLVRDRLTLYVAYGVAGVIRLDWSQPDSPQLLELAPTVGEATAVAVSPQGRVYVADHGGGLVYFK